jgi:hypothetical protein
MTALARTDWQLGASCRGNPAPLPLPCPECPVRAECLEEGLTHRVQTGIWGGLSVDDRKAYLRITRHLTALPAIDRGSDA